LLNSGSFAAKTPGVESAVSNVDQGLKVRQKPETNWTFEPKEPAAPRKEKPASAPPPPAETSGLGPRTKLLLVAAILIAAGAFAWWYFSKPGLPPGFAAGNGRLEATEYFVSTKYPGRIKEVLFNEGDTVNAGQVVARMDTSALDAQLREAEAKIRTATESRKVALAQVDVKQADYTYYAKQYTRSRGLVGRGAVSGQEAEIDLAHSLSSRAELAAAKVQVVQSESDIDAAKAAADKLRAEIHDAVLVSPIRARIETRLAEPGEVLPAGGRVFSINDLSDVYMYVYLPESVTGKIPLGSEARIVLDAAPQYPVRTYVSYVSPTAQFTPKTVETEEERHNLTFRVKLQVDKARLRNWEQLVKVGLPGMGYVRWDQSAPWPADLQPKAVVPRNLWQPTGSSQG
jgi:HlyD family secretion protein